jgi:uncharacterized protein (TIGR03437 family)
MSDKKKILVGKMACVLGVIPVLMFAYSSGPDPKLTLAPGDSTASCTQCHGGKLNSFGGSVKLIPGSDSYTPGTTQAITITIADPTQKAWGFQLTARDQNNTQAGDFENVSSATQVICITGSPKADGKPCSMGSTLQWAEHTLEGYSAGRGKVGTFSFTINWTAPATDMGKVTFYVSANAGNGTDSGSQGHIYTSTLELSPAAAGGPKPAITSGSGVVNAATNLTSSIAPNTYITIYGSNLATTTRLWGGSDFGASGTSLPTSLSGTSVTVNGKPAYVEYISPTQINAITPSDSATGSGINVVVTTNGQPSDASSVTITALSPGFFTFDGKYVAAADATTGSFIGKTGLFASAPNLTTPAKPGQLITLYGTGFGPTSPAIPQGQITDKVYNLSPVPGVNIGGAAAAVAFAGLVPPFAQVYQFNVTIPATAADGDLQIFSQQTGATSPNSAVCCFITVKR